MALRLPNFVQNILSPGAAYAAKFEVTDAIAHQSSGVVLQFLTLAAILQLPLGPLAAYYWPVLSRPMRLLSLVGGAAYASFFLFIGTLQGLGFLLVGVLAGFMARRVSSAIGIVTATEVRRRQRVTRLAVIALALFAVYMINAQSQRLTQFNVNDRFQPDSILESLTNRNFARGVAVVIHYPTHGYQGLGYDLETPFRWTEMRGSSVALDTYWEQYFGTSVKDDTYPARTEARTGYPADVVWSTVYPWLASDLSWAGTLVLMVFLGRWTARMWLGPCGSLIRWH